MEAKELPPEKTHEDLVSIGDNRGWNAMQTNNFPHKHCCHWSCKWVLKAHKVSILRKSVHHYKNRVLLAYGWKRFAAVRLDIPPHTGPCSFEAKTIRVQFLNRSYVPLNKRIIVKVE